MAVIITPPQDITALVAHARDAVMGKDALEALRNLANLYPGPEEAEVRAGSERLLARSFGRQMMGTRRVTRDGRVAAVAPAYGGSAEDREARLKADMVHDCQLMMSLVVSGQILPALQEITLEHPLDEQIFIALARESPIVPAGRGRSYGRGLHAGYHGDFEVAVHLLVPQLEHLVRCHLKAAGALTTTLSKEGDVNENGLSTLIGLAEMRTVFGDDLTFELSAVFSDAHGANLRNELAHGLLADGDLYSSAGIYAWWLAFRLAFWHFWSARRPGGGTDSAAAAHGDPGEAQVSVGDGGEQ